ncbi:hypothetical protein FRB90_012010 [Tulasnella sp. 427]|nr:hypothetical protein FRB90_012010 [Tulasnella sp. 427]
MDKRLGKPWILNHFKEHVKQVGGYSGGLEGESSKPCQLIRLRNSSSPTEYVWYVISDRVHQVTARIRQEVYDAFADSMDHSNPLGRPLVILLKFKSEWASRSNDDRTPVITIHEFELLATEENIIGKPQEIWHDLNAWWEQEQRQNSERQERPATSSASKRAAPSKGASSTTAALSNVRTPAEAPPKRSLLDRWPDLVLSRDACFISSGDMQTLDKIAFAGFSKERLASSPELISGEESFEAPGSADSDGGFEWPASPGRDGDSGNVSGYQQIKEEPEDDDVHMDQEEEPEKGPPRGRNRSPGFVLPSAANPSQSSTGGPSLSLPRPAILVPDSDTSMTQSTNSQGLSQAKQGIRRPPPPNSSMEVVYQTPLPIRQLQASSTGKLPATGTRPPPPLFSAPRASDFRTTEGPRSSTPIGHSSSSPSNLGDRDNSPGGMSISSKASASRLRSRPSWIKPLTQEEVKRRMSSIDPSSPIQTEEPSVPIRHVVKQSSSQNIKAEQLSQGLGSSDPKPPQPNWTEASEPTESDESTVPIAIPRVPGARITAHRTTSQKYQDLGDLLSKILAQNRPKP